MSNQSNEYYPDSTPSSFISQLPRKFEFHGNWVVGLCEVNFPNSLLHIDKNEGIVYLECGETIITSISEGVYPQTDSITWALNEDVSLKKHFEFVYNSLTRFVTIKKIYKTKACQNISHNLQLGKKLSSILGFPYLVNGMEFTGNLHKTGNIPASLLRALPRTFHVFSDICNSHIIGNSSRPVLRIVPFEQAEYRYGSSYAANFTPHFYPVSHHSFETIEIDIKDEDLKNISFAYGPSYVTLHFVKID